MHHSNDKNNRVMKRYISRILLAVSLTLSLVSCEKFLEQDLDNRLTEEEMLNDPAFFEGLLLHAYNAMPSINSFGLDIAADDAATNDKNSDALKMATGEWSSSYYPMAKWSQAYNEIVYINSFLEKMGQVEWSWESEVVSMNHFERLKGEAYGLRAWWEFQILEYHAGMSDGGQLLGFPIVTKVITIDDDYTLSRDLYSACVDQILADIDTAVKYLPNTYADVSGDPVYNSTFGKRFQNRMSGLAALALRSRVTLFAASPAFDYLDWETAAVTAGEIIRDNGMLSAISSTGLEFYKDYQNSEIIWCNAKRNSNSLERDNYPPSQFGMGRTNPSQELVDAFPMENGLPITEPSSGYDPDDPYAGRDPRFTAYIVYNGNSIKEPISTDLGSPEDGINRSVNSTRSGYYLKKFLLDSKVNLTPGNETQAEHFITYFRFSEMFLNYAEAANEAWGPDADPMGYGFTARQVLSAIRERGGLPALASDTYLNSITPSQDDFRTLVRNERRIELCFEGARFWDIRRWNLTGVMSAPVHAMHIDFDGPAPYEIQFMENRNYSDHMIYGPVPYAETLKYDLAQNKG
jgi:hypothetical protein